MSMSLFAPVSTKSAEPAAAAAPPVGSTDAVPAAKVEAATYVDWTPVTLETELIAVLMSEYVALAPNERTWLPWAPATSIDVGAVRFPPWYTRLACVAAAVTVAVIGIVGELPNKAESTSKLDNFAVSAVLTCVVNALLPSSSFSPANDVPDEIWLIAVRRETESICLLDRPVLFGDEIWVHRRC